MTNPEAPVPPPAQEAANYPSPVDSPHLSHSEDHDNERLPIEIQATEPIAASSSEEEDHYDAAAEDLDDEPDTDFWETRGFLILKSCKRVCNKLRANSVSSRPGDADEWYDFKYWDAFGFSDPMMDEVWDRVYAALQQDSESLTLLEEVSLTQPHPAESDNIDLGRVDEEYLPPGPLAATVQGESSSSGQRKRRLLDQDYQESVRALRKSRVNALASAGEVSASRPEPHGSVHNLEAAAENQPLASSSAPESNAVATRSRSRGKPPL